jgi:CheY-like chemotaxis protein
MCSRRAAWCPRELGLAGATDARGRTYARNRTRADARAQLLVSSVANLLLVDDDLDLSDACAEVLRGQGHEVRLARNGSEGLACVAEAFPDLILCDVEMPVLDGQDMAHRLREVDAGRERIPILLISGVVRIRDIADQIGTPYFLGKPFTISQLVDKVTRALREQTPPRPHGS